MAGDSAREHARRAREKAERLHRYADQWEKGAEGEAHTAEVLRAGLSAEWTVMHDVRWPGRARANIDHLAVGPAGIFVIDSKNWSGRVSIAGGVLLQNGRRREQAVVGCAEAALAVARRVPDLADHISPVLCFTREERVADRARDVFVCSASTLVELLTTRPRVWDAHAVHLATDRLRSLTPATQTSARPAPPSARPAPRRAATTSARATPARRARPHRRRSRTRRVLGGLLLWYLACCVAYAGLGPLARANESPGLLVGAYVFLGVMTAATVSGGRRRRRTS